MCDSLITSIKNEGVAQSELHTSELFHRAADLTHAHVGVSRDGEGVQLPTAQVQEGTAAVGRLAGGVDACGAAGSDGEVLSPVTAAPAHRGDAAAAVLLHRGVLWLAGG